jgi:hypothetical protein
MKIPIIKKRHEKMGVDVLKVVNKSMGDKRNGTSVIIAGGVLFATLFFLLMGVLQLLIRVSKSNIVFTIPYFAVFFLIGFTLSYFFVLKNNKYLAYFKKFEKWTKPERHKYVYVSLLFLLLVVVVFFAGLMI